MLTAEDAKFLGVGGCLNNKAQDKTDFVSWECKKKSFIIIYDKNKQKNTFETF